MDSINGTSNSYLNRVNNNPYLGKTIRFSTGHICYVTQQGVIKYIGNMDIWNGVDPTYTYVDVNIPFLDSYWTYGTYIPELNLITGTNVELNQSLTNAGENVFVNRLTTNPKETYKGCYRDKPPATEIMFIPQMNNTNSVSGFSCVASSIYQQNNDFAGPWRAFDGDVNTFWHSEVYSDSTGWGPYDAWTGEYKGNLAQSYTDSNGDNTAKGEYLELRAPNNFVLTKYDVQGRQDCCGNPNGRSPNSWVILGWDGVGGSGWKLIDKQDNQALDYAMKTYFISNSLPYQWFRFITTNCGNPGDRSGNRYCVQISIWNLYTSSDAFFTDSQRAMIRDPSQIDRVDLETCKTYAAQNGYTYFGMQDVQSDGNAQCLVSNELAKSQMYGEAFNYNPIPLWDSKTFGNVGNTALFNNFGSLVVLNSSGAAIYSTPNPDQNGNYLGCFADKEDRAMPNISNNQYIPLEECRQLAIDQGLDFYGVQDGHGTDNGWCAGSNDINSIKKYGLATNCTKDSNGKDMGGPWSNAVYSVKGYGEYFLMLQDDGNMCIYKGADPNSIQGGAIWCSGTNGQAKDINPNFAASKGKYGKNWITSGTALAPNDFIGSNTGAFYLLMQTDGNLVLYTSTASSACSTNSNGQNLGGSWVNAVYELSPQGFKDNLGKVAYIDENAMLHSYAADKLKLNTNYAKLSNFDSYGNDIPNAAYGNSTIDQCKSSCNNLQDCYGFVFNNNDNVCYPKTSGMYPVGPTRYYPGLDTYTRGKQPIAVPIGASNKLAEIDSSQYQYYINGGDMADKYGLANATSEQQEQLKVLQNKLNALSSQINSSTNRYQTGTIDSQNQASRNLQGLDKYVKQRYNVEQQISGILGSNSLNTQIESFVNNFSVESILKDSDIVVLQKNYEYLFWTILAAASVIIAINIIKKNK